MISEYSWSMGRKKINKDMWSKMLGQDKERKKGDKIKKYDWSLRDNGDKPTQEQ